LSRILIAIDYKPLSSMSPPRTHLIVINIKVKQPPISNVTRYPLTEKNADLFFELESISMCILMNNKEALVGFIP
jgi:hypothetical protein